MREVTETKTLFKFDELSPEAQEKAIEAYRAGDLDYEWYDGVYQNVEDAAKILGIELGQKPVKLMNGDTRYNPAIYFSGFWNQGDGACFEGSYSYAKGAVKAIKDEFPTDEKLHRIAADLQAVQAKEFYQLAATVTHNDRYYHYNSVDIEVYRNEMLAAILNDETKQASKVALGLIYSIPHPVSGDRCDYILWAHLPESNRVWVQLKSCVRPEFHDKAPLLSGYDFHVEFKDFKRWCDSDYAVRVA
jgi:hypothetical protein